MRENKKALGCLLGAMLLASACGIEGNGIPGEEQRELSTFQGLELSGGDIEVIASATHKPGQGRAQVIITGDENLLRHVRTRVHEGRLEVDSSDCLDPSLPLVVKVATPELRMVDISGSGKAEIRNIGAPSFEVDISGSGQVTLEGQVNTLNGDISGSGKIYARELEAERAMLDISGSGRAHVCAHELVRGDISGSGRVTYYCDPDKVERDISGSGKVRAGQ